MIMTSRGGPDIADPSQAFGSYVLIESSVPIDMFAFLLRLVLRHFCLCGCVLLGVTGGRIVLVASPIRPIQTETLASLCLGLTLLSAELIPSILSWSLPQQTAISSYSQIHPDDMKDHAMSETPNMESVDHMRAWTYCKKYTIDAKYMLYSPKLISPSDTLRKTSH